MNNLIKNLNLIISSADMVFDNDDYTSATILYFKALFAALDMIILKKLGITPKDHTERFRMLEKNMPEIYVLLDKYFRIYRDTYSVSIDKNTCTKIKDEVKRIIKEQGI